MIAHISVVPRIRKQRCKHLNTRDKLRNPCLLLRIFGYDEEHQKDGYKDDLYEENGQKIFSV
jgi:hypothetical protein